MKARHLEFLVEEPSMEHFLRTLLERVLPAGCTFSVHSFNGKQSLLRKLPDRLRGYRHWLPPDHRVVVIVDRDGDDCRQLKDRLEGVASGSDLRTRTTADDDGWQVVNRIAIEELEAWYFGDWEAVRSVYPHLSPSIPRKAAYRDPDAIQGGTWEAFERILKRRGYFRTGLRKTAAARAIAAHIDPARNRSASFAKLYDAIVEAVT